MPQVRGGEGGSTEQFLRAFYKSIHDDPGWADFLERVGIAPEQLDAIKFELKLP